MSAGKRLLLIYAGGAADRTDKAMCSSRLGSRLLLALRARGAEIEEIGLETNADAVLDRLEAGAIPVVIKSGC